MATEPNYSEYKEYAAKKLKLHVPSQSVGTPEQVSAFTDTDPKSPDVQKSGQAPGETGHYSRFNPQPIDIIAAWNLDHWQAEAITYIVRHDMKGGREDLEKAIWYLRDLIERRYGD